jgi:histidinol dehydrogenase
VRVERWRADGDPAATAARARELVPAGHSVEDVVREIVGDVRARGDAAVADYTRRLDTHGDEPPAVRVEPHELQDALGALDPAVRRGLETAAANVRTVAEAALGEDREVKLAQGHTVRLREVPVHRAGVYVPGGRAPYPSTVIMGVVTARAAGVGSVAVCAPPSGGSAGHETILAACALSGVTEVYRMGGAQAIAALAYGTETVPPVDVIVGPGNLYVQEAKRQVFGRVGIDSLAGPSDVLIVLAGEDADPRLAALDLLAQAEHGPGTLVLAVSPEVALLDEVAAELGERASGATGAVCVLVETATAEEALAVAEAFSPEHLQLMGSAAEALASQVTRAGCLFSGAGAATAFGDYVAGSNHVLPTGGASRFSSALGPGHFRRRMAQVEIAGAAAQLAPGGAAIARAEGFVLHAESMEARMGQDG